MVFHSSRLVLTVPGGLLIFYGFSWFEVLFNNFHGSRSVLSCVQVRFIVFQSSRLVFHGFRRDFQGSRWIFMFFIVLGRFFMVPGQFSWLQVGFYGFSSYFLGGFKVSGGFFYGSR